MDFTVLARDQLEILQSGDPLVEAVVRACARRVLVLLQHVDALGGGGLVVAPHVVVHLRETLLHVILGAALPHRPKPEAQGGMVQLRRCRKRGRKRGSRWRSRPMHPRPELLMGVGDLESDNPSQMIPLFAH